MRQIIKKKNVSTLLKSIIHEFIKLFEGNFTSPLEQKEELMKSYIEAIEGLCGKSSRAEYFVGEIRHIL